MNVSISLPLPAEVLHANGRTRNHAYRARLIKSARGDAAFLANQAAGRNFRPFESAELQATFYMPRRRDEDGLIGWLKPYIDGIVADAGLVSNDSRLRILPPKQVTGKEAGSRREVVIELRPIDQRKAS